jgi:iron transport multicopper oxidase
VVISGILTVVIHKHPIHLHGHSFHVVRSAGSSTYNFDNPVIRDVVSMGEMGDNVTIRFFTDNPGPWFLHCHIDWHLVK